MKQKTAAVKNLPAVRQNSPSEMIHYAIEKGADLDKLEKLLKIKQEYEKDEARKAYHKAMAAFKANAPKINKDKKVGYDGKQGGRVGYKHASLYNVTEKISAELSKHGLSVSWIPKTPNQTADPTKIKEMISVTTRITHELGHSEECTLSAPDDNTGSKNAIQAVGSTITYLERYGVLALCGLATYDQDDDGNGVVKEYISEIELHDLKVLISDNKIDEKKFLDYLGIESVDKLPKSEHKKALAAIEAKKKGGAK